MHPVCQIPHAHLFPAFPERALRFYPGELSCIIIACWILSVFCWVFGSRYEFGVSCLEGFTESSDSPIFVTIHKDGPMFRMEIGGWEWGTWKRQW